MHDRFVTIVDESRSACLCDVGAPGYYVAICVNSKGEEWPWLVCSAELLAAEQRLGKSYQLHELHGPLPDEYTDRLRRIRFTCGRTTQAGRPCRARVGTPGDACGWHRDRQPQPGLPL